MHSTSVDIGRRNLLRGRVSALQEPSVLMPWASATFFDSCSRCLDCVQACPEGIISPADGGYPSVDFDRGECLFCGDCVSACTPAALLRGAGPPWRIKAEISSECLSERGISCRSCGDVCDPRAIGFSLQLGGRVAVNLEPSYCTGCGACVGVCPVHAIRMRQPQGQADQARANEGVE
jgi:ferredoxin-type protein NapF